jgi:single-strand DNA-binding protein
MSNQQEAFENKFILAGKIYQIGQEQTFASGFRKRTIVLQDKVYAENMFQFEVHKDRCDELDKYKEGDNVKVHFNVRCNDYKGKFYTNLVAWRLEKMSTADAVAGADGAFKDEFGATHYDDKKDGEDLDLPF